MSGLGDEAFLLALRLEFEGETGGESCGLSAT